MREIARRKQQEKEQTVKCITVLFCGLEACPLRKYQYKSINYV